MGFQLSPGVNVSEIDLTGFVPAVATSGAGFVGQFEWGPVMDYTTLENKKLLQKWFGKPTEVNYRDWYSCSNFLDYSNNLNVIRVIDDAVALNSDVSGTGILIKNKTHYDQVYGTPTGDASFMASKFPGSKGDSIKIIMVDSNTYDSVYSQYGDVLPNKPKTSEFVKSVGGENDELHILVLDTLGQFTGTPGAILETYQFVSKARNGIDLDGKPIFYGTVLNNESEYLWFLEVPDSSEMAIGGSIQSITLVDGGDGYTTVPAVTITGDGTGATATATLNPTGNVADNVIVTDGGDYEIAPLVTITGDGTGALGTANLDSAGGLSSVTVTNGGDYETVPTVVIGGDGMGATATAILDTLGGLSTIAVISGGSGYASGDTIAVTGDGMGATAEVATETGGVIDTITVTASGSGYTNVTIDADTTSGTGTGATATGNLSFPIATVTVDVAGTGYTTAPISFTGGDGLGGGLADSNLSFPIATITVTQGGIGYTSATVSFDSGSATATASVEYSVASVTVDSAGVDYNDGTTNVDIAIENGTQATATAVVTPGADYDALWNTPALNSKYQSLANVWEKNMLGGVDSISVDENELILGWDMFRNAEVVDVSLLILGDAGENLGANGHTTVVKHVVENIASWRKDCVAFYSPKYADVVNQPETLATENAITTRNDINLSSSYGFMDSGWKYQYDVHNDTYRWIPLNADIAGVCAQSDLARDPWWSPAGFNRGQIKNVIKLALNPNKGNRDELYQSNINPVVSFVGEGVLLYGDRTQLTRPSLFQKLNVRRLFIVLEKAIAKSAKYQLFEFNDAFTRAQFVSQVEPYLRDVQGRRGINDFRVVCDETNNTGEVIDRSEFVGDIYIKPNNSINFIQLNFVAVRNGVDFNEVVGQI